MHFSSLSPSSFISPGEHQVDWPGYRTYDDYWKTLVYRYRLEPCQMMNQRYTCIYWSCIILQTLSFVHISLVSTRLESPKVTAIASSSSSIKSNKEGEAEPDIRGMSVSTQITLSHTVTLTHSHCHTIHSPQFSTWLNVCIHWWSWLAHLLSLM